jgi:hypothetical protein
LPYFTGLSPCPLTTIIMVVALANGMVTLGLLVTFSMALGMIGTVSLFALAVILARRLLLDLLTRHAAHVERVARALEILGAAAVTAIGLLLFAFEFVEGNTITRLYFMKLRRLSVEAVRQGHFTGELAQVRAEPVPTFTHFLDLPILMLIVSLGALRPDTWTHFLVGSAVAIAVAIILTVALPRLYISDPMMASPRTREP